MKSGRTGRAPVLVNRISPVGDEPTLADEVAERVDRGQLLPSRQRDDQVTMNRRRRAPGDDQPAIRAARHCREAAFDFAGIAHIDWAQLHPKRRSCGETTVAECVEDANEEEFSREDLDQAAGGDLKAYIREAIAKAQGK